MLFVNADGVSHATNATDIRLCVLNKTFDFYFRTDNILQLRTPDCDALISNHFRDPGKIHRINQRFFFKSFSPTHFFLREQKRKTDYLAAVA